MARESRCRLAYALLFALLFGCSSKSRSSDDGQEPELVGKLCVDPVDACCCDAENLFVEPAAGGPACRISYVGDPSDWTFELVTEEDSIVLPHLASAAECGASGGWYPSSSVEMQLELCESTCELRRNQRTMLRSLSGCPAVPC